MDLENVFEQYPQIQEVYETIGEWEIWLHTQAVKIRVTKSLNGTYSFDSSHHYKGSGQADAYRTSRLTFATAEDALKHALLEKTLFYDPNDEGALWIRKEDY